MSYEHRVTAAEVHASKEAREQKDIQPGTKQTDGNIQANGEEDIARIKLEKDQFWIKRERKYIQNENMSKIDRIRIYIERNIYRRIT